jgi:hypothetical protein
MKLRASLAAVVAVVLVVVVAPEATGKGAGGIPQATSNIPGCAPRCLPPGKAVPGNLPTGTYQTQYFFAKQMKLSFARGWFSEEDSTGEFAAYAKKNRNSRVVFWEDVYTVKVVIPGHWRQVGPSRRTAASLLTWLQGNPNLTVSKPTSGRIGAIRARVVDIGVADDAVNDDPGCPAKACANFLGYTQWGEPYGIAGKSISRFYLADVRYGGKQHLFVAVIETTGTAQLRAFLPDATKILASVRVPALSA